MRKEKASVPVISQSPQVICMKFGLLLKLVGQMNLTFVFSHPYSMQRREPFLGDLVQTSRQANFNSGFCFENKKSSLNSMY